ncbi:PilW family protein [Paraburkholderia aromaticivorans]|uniref:Type IV pillus assembly protein n=1 Tax=Paraburkholderia aromaticivorans TaxID=2026199 RepID=A0A248VDI4_9BURK|nr:PilW family protein [Paraburkholderia aromaticivorans]ASV97115.1 type IV pillus assembly protein [Paraburkholderia aromaticivorans]
MRRRPNRARGHTLVEFAIAMALGLLVSAGAVSLYTTQRSAFEHASDAMRIREAGLIALTLIGQQLQMAGFVPADVARYTRPAPLFGCSGGRPVGADDSLACETLPSHSDGVAVRYVGDNVSTWPSASGQTTDCLGQAVTGASAALGDKGVQVVNRYFARVSGSSGEPELYCEGNGKTGSAQPLVEGVERVRIKYWVAGALAALDASAVSADQWARIVAVDLCVLVRGAPQGQRSRYVDCDGVSASAADFRPRQAFSRRVAIRNHAEDSP